VGSFLAGAGFALAGAPREAWGLGLASLALWLGLMSRRRVWDAATPGQAAARGAREGLAFGVGANAVALGWSVGLLERFAAFPPWASWGTSALLWIAQGLPSALGTALAAGLAAGLREGSALRPGTPSSPPEPRRAGPWLLTATLPVALSAVPAIFPWRPAATQLPVLSLVQAAELGGEPLVDVLLLLTLVAATEGLRHRGGRARGRRLQVAQLLLAVVLPTATAVAGAHRLATVEAARAAAPRVRVGLVQPNVPVGGKRDPRLRAERRRALHRATRELGRAGAGLVVWPETAHPYAVPRDARRDSPGAASIRPVGFSGAILAGAITRGEGRFNSVLAVDPTGWIRGISDKVRLVPFGERVPFCPTLPWLEARLGTCGLTPGRAPKVLTPDSELRVGVLNCYEDVLADQARVVTRQAPDLLANVTNDAWFGDTAEPHLHLAVSRFRAIEARRELVRSTNTGVTAHVAATGEVRTQTEVFQPGTLLVDVPLLDLGPTLWVRAGDWVTYGLFGGLAGVFFAAASGPGRPPRSAGTKRTS